jgi:glyoxylase-like metal-dependent hydrolase (beta-lactamase superfamily II)
MFKHLRARNPIILATAAVVTLVGGAGVGLRVSRTAFTPPTELAPGLWTSKTGGGIFVLAARVGTGAVLFDAGVDPEAHGIDALLTSMKLGRADVGHVFLTHGHPDHTAAIAVLPAAKVFAGAADVDLVTGREKPEAFLIKIFALIWSNPPGRVTNPLTGAVTVPVGDGKVVQAFPVPGHTRGSYAYVFDGVLITGDIMTLAGGSLAPTPSLFDAHPAENLTAIRELARALTGVTISRVCTAHGGCTLPGQGRQLFDALVASISVAGS